MNAVVDIPWPLLLLFGATLLVPLAINYYYQLGIAKDTAIGVLRMGIQLTLVGVYLEFLFQLDSMTVNLLWLVVMIMIGSSSILDKARLPKQRLFLPVVGGLVVGLAPVLLLICLAIVRPTPLYNAQYVIPLAGMLLGNSLGGNIVALQNFFSALEERKSEYEAAIALGASVRFATLPFLREAIRKSLAPTLASMTTSGLVTLPGMMTGQILGGANPIVAIKYQIMIMIAIFVMMSVSITICLNLTVRRGIHPHGLVMIKPLSNK
ncbi:ABC transporter permease [Vibrio sp. MarTm2]|uniref:ABC transporter permease n=1 Tax=Vibrio sp. MarTm2 TaxID=2998831 RepID=UPI0022CDB88A|nr:ABC transporter permease [Vibrio sp. MarTm2]MDA0127614.1 ABC transporter permease [Vibrio sp. MarTm2]